MGMVVNKADDQVFEFAPNKFGRFRVRLSVDRITVQTVHPTTRKVVRTWSADLANIETIEISDRIGRRTRNGSVRITPRSGESLLFAWTMGPSGVGKDEGRKYYTAAEALFTSLAQMRPDLSVVMNAGSRSLFLIGSAVAPLLALAAIAHFTEVWTLMTWATAAFIVGLSILSVLRSGVMAKARQLSIAQAITELATKRAAL